MRVQRPKRLWEKEQASDHLEDVIQSPSADAIPPDPEAFDPAVGCTCAATCPATGHQSSVTSPQHKRSILRLSSCTPHAPFLPLGSLKGAGLACV